MFVMWQNFSGCPLCLSRGEPGIEVRIQNCMCSYILVFVGSPWSWWSYRRSWWQGELLSSPYAVSCNTIWIIHLTKVFIYSMCFLYSPGTHRPWRPLRYPRSPRSGWITWKNWKTGIRCEWNSVGEDVCVHAREKPIRIDVTAFFCTICWVLYYISKCTVSMLRIY